MSERPDENGSNGGRKDFKISIERVLVVITVAAFVLQPIYSRLSGLEDEVKAHHASHGHEGVIGDLKRQEQALLTETEVRRGDIKSLVETNTEQNRRIEALETEVEYLRRAWEKPPRNECRK